MNKQRCWVEYPRRFSLWYNYDMKYEITNEVVEGIKQELIRVNVPVQTLIGIEKALIATPIKVEVTEETE